MECSTVVSGPKLCRGAHLLDALCPLPHAHPAVRWRWRHCWRSGRRGRANRWGSVLHDVPPASDLAKASNRRSAAVSALQLHPRARECSSVVGAITSTDSRLTVQLAFVNIDGTLTSRDHTHRDHKRHSAALTSACHPPQLASGSASVPAKNIAAVWLLGGLPPPCACLARKQAPRACAFAHLQAPSL